MDDQKNYYTPMSDNAFNEIKEKAIEIWKSYDDTYGYASEKINAIKDIKNVRDNGMYIIAMFDVVNMRKLFHNVSLGTLKEIIDERMPNNLY